MLDTSKFKQKNQKYAFVSHISVDCFFCWNIPQQTEKSKFWIPLWSMFSVWQILYNGQMTCVIEETEELKHQSELEEQVEIWGESYSPAVSYRTNLLEGQSPNTKSQPWKSFNSVVNSKEQAILLLLRQHGQMSVVQWSPTSFSMLPVFVNFFGSWFKINTLRS